MHRPYIKIGLEEWEKDKKSWHSLVGRTPTPSSESAARPCPLSCNSRDCRDCDSCRSPRSWWCSLRRRDSYEWRGHDVLHWEIPGTSCPRRSGRPCRSDSRSCNRIDGRWLGGLLITCMTWENLMAPLASHRAIVVTFTFIYLCSWLDHHTPIRSLYVSNMTLLPTFQMNSCVEPFRRYTGCIAVIPSNSNSTAVQWK